MSQSTTARLNRAKEQIKAAGCDLLLVSTPENRRYLTGFSGSSGLVLVNADGGSKAVLITDGRYWAQVEQQCPQVELVRFRAEEHGSLIECAARYLRDRKGLLGVESRHLVVGDFQALQRGLGEDWGVVPTDQVVEKVRQIKDEAELEAMRGAAQIGDRALRNALSALKAGMTEREFCLELEYQMQKLGARKPAFDSIVASGSNGAFPHAGVTDRPIAQGELITLDFGVFRDGYNSDITRTVWLGTLNERNRFLYESVRKAQQLAVEAVAPGKTCKEIDAVARGVLIECGLGEYFSHGLGHGIGLAVHEAPSVRSTCDTVLQEGMVITIEPGVYVPGETGCRVEDSVVVTASGCQKLTRSPYQEVGQSHPLEAVGA